MPPIRSMPMIKPVKTERSHEENQERAYIAASRRSDRSLEARVESARRASEIHKRRTGRSLRVREEDVMNEEMYEEEDDDLSSQARRFQALQGLTGPLGDRLQSSLAMQIGMRDALSQALYRNRQYQDGQNANASAFTSPMMQHNFMNPMVQSPQPLQSPHAAPPSSPWAQMNAQQNFYPQNAPVTSSHDLSRQQSQPQMVSPYLAAKHSPRLSMDSRRRSMPVQQGLAPQPAHSPSGSHPSTPLDLGSNVKFEHSPQQVPTPPHSTPAPTPGQGSATASPQAPQRAQTQQDRLDSITHPLTLQLPVETQQILGVGQAFNSTFFPSQKQMGSYNYNPNGTRKASPTDTKRGMSQPSPAAGLNQTIAPSALYNMDSSFNYSDPQTAMTTPADFLFGYGANGMSDYDFNNNNYALNGSELMNFGGGDDDAMINGGWHTPGLNPEPSWNPDDFVNFGPPST